MFLAILQKIYSDFISDENAEAQQREKYSTMFNRNELKFDS